MRARRWCTGRIALVGDAAHAAHFSAGSGTRLALDDALALADSLGALRGDVPAGLARYESARRPRVEPLMSAARASQSFFERLAEHRGSDPADLARRLLSRSGRELRIRDSRES